MTNTQQMENLIIDSSVKTPQIDFNAEKGVLLFKGRSIPENSINFFKPLNDWINLYCEQPNNATTIEIKLEYFNTSSSKCLLDILRRFERVAQTGKDVVVKWFFETEDDDMEEAGEDYKAIIKLPFELIEVEEI
jgi:hypothetical protein